MYRLLTSVSMLIGLTGSLGSGWYVVRGPFFGYPIPPADSLLVACGVFILTTYVFAWGFDGWYQSLSGDRPDIDEDHDHTMEFFGPR